MASKRSGRAGRGTGTGSEKFQIHWVHQSRGGHGIRAEKFLRGDPAEFALVNDKICFGTQSPHRRVVTFSFRSGPSRIPHPILVPDDDDATVLTGFHEIRREVGLGAADEIKHIEAGCVRGKRLAQMQKLHGSAVDDFAVIEDPSKRNHGRLFFTSAELPQLLLMDLPRREIGASRIRDLAAVKKR